MKLQVLPTKLKPKRGISQILHILINALLPLALFLLISRDLSFVAYLLIFASKWRTFAVKLRHWTANIRANLVDASVGLATVYFMSTTSSTSTRIVWSISYLIWLIVIKPRSDTLSVILQAIIAQTLGVTALTLNATLLNDYLFVYLIAIWVLCYASARHYLTNFDEPYVRIIATIWSTFAIQLAWVFSRWVALYLFLPQFSFLMTILSIAIGLLYYLDKQGKLNRLAKTQIFSALAIIIFIVVISAASTWQDSRLN